MELKKRKKILCVYCISKEMIMRAHGQTFLRRFEEHSKPEKSCIPLYVKKELPPSSQYT